MKSKNIKSLFVFLLSVVMLLSVAACGSSSAVATDAAATDAPAATDAAATDAPAASGDVVAAYVFTNTGSVEICELYLSPTGLDSWGPDQLKSQTIAVGGKFTLTNVPTGVYDAKIVGCNGAGESTGQLDIHN